MPKKIGNSSYWGEPNLTCSMIYSESMTKCSKKMDNYTLSILISLEQTELVEVKDRKICKIPEEVNNLIFNLLYS